MASLSLSYRFGSLKLGNAPRKAGGVEEEKEGRAMDKDKLWKINVQNKIEC